MNSESKIRQLAKWKSRCEGLAKYNDSLNQENEHLRDILNDVSFRLGVEEEAHYYSEDNYEECHRVVLDAIDNRVVPENFVWPRFVSGEPVKLVSVAVTEEGNSKVSSVEFDSCGCTVVCANGYRAEKVSLYSNEYKVPAQLLDSTGREIDVGCVVFEVNNKRDVVLVTSVNLVTGTFNGFAAHVQVNNVSDAVGVMFEEVADRNPRNYIRNDS